MRNKNIDKLLFEAPFHLVKLNKMGCDLEKEHQTKATLVLFCLIMDNGEAVYEMWNIPETKKNMPKLIEALRMSGIKIYDEILESIAILYSYSVFGKVVSNKNES